MTEKLLMAISQNFFIGSNQPKYLIVYWFDLSSLATINFILLSK